MAKGNALTAYTLPSEPVTHPPTVSLCQTKRSLSLLKIKPPRDQRTNLLMNETNKEAEWRRQRPPLSWHFLVAWQSAPCSELYINYQAMSGRHFCQKDWWGAVRRRTNLTWPGLKGGPLILMGCIGGSCVRVCGALKASTWAWYRKDDYTRKLFDMWKEGK